MKSSLLFLSTLVALGLAHPLESRHFNKHEQINDSNFASETADTPVMQLCTDSNPDDLSADCSTVDIVPDDSTSTILISGLRSLNFQDNVAVAGCQFYSAITADNECDDNSFKVSMTPDL